MYPETTSLNISFYIRRTRPNKHGEVPVCVRITVNGQRADTTIRKSILPDQWDAIRGQASPRTTLGKAINLYLENVRARLAFVHRELEFEQRPYTVHDVLERFLGAAPRTAARSSSSSASTTRSAASWWASTWPRRRPGVTTPV